MTRHTEPASNRRTYHRADVVVVYKTKDAFGGLSNMAAGFPLQINRSRILTVEALYQSCRFPHLPNVQREIIQQRSPMTAKMKSKPHRKDTRHDWTQVRTHVMRWCLRVKLAQHYDDFGRLLLATKERPIVEQSRKDDYWGAKVAGGADDTLVGENVLGRLLMELRELLKNEPSESLKEVAPLAIPDFLLFGRPIETVRALYGSSSGARRTSACLLCGTAASYRSADHGNRKHFHCPECSEYQITLAAESTLKSHAMSLRARLSMMAAALDANHVLVIDVPQGPRLSGVAYESLRATPASRSELSIG